MTEVIPSEDVMERRGTAQSGGRGLTSLGERQIRKTCERSIDHSAEITQVWGVGGGGEDNVISHEKTGGGRGYRCLYGRDVISRILSSHMQGHDQSPDWNMVFFVPHTDVLMDGW